MPSHYPAANVCSHYFLLKTEVAVRRYMTKMAEGIKCLKR